ncbi:MAG TPA: hypothetical protein VLE48_03535 [Terriglobales bacterium]|nr:hypothetical protein [Terriglobales bacterium]
MPIRTLLFAALLTAAQACAQTGPATPFADQLAAMYPEVDALYLDLHQHPELSMREQETAAKLADRLKALGYEVTSGVGKMGVVACCATVTARRSCYALTWTRCRWKKRPVCRTPARSPPATMPAQPSR